MPGRRLARRARSLAVALALVAALAGCGSGSSSGATGPASTPTATGSPPSGAPTTGGSSPTSSATGSSDHPAAVTATDDPLAWHEVAGPTRAVVTVGGRWRLTVAPGGDSARLAGPHPRTVQAGAHSSITDAFLDGTHALVVSEDDRATTPDVATLVDLATGRATTLDRTSTPPTGVGGTWALGPGTVAHATTGTGRSYCVVFVALGSGREEGRTCVPPRHGLSRAAITPDGTTFMRFDAHHPSCRTLVVRAGDRDTPLPGVTPCQGWDSAAVPGGAVWSVVPNERRIEAGHFYARTASGWFDLGRGTSGSLVACAGAAYFVRDPASRHAPATLLRWDPRRSTLATVFASKGRGNAFLSPPRCGGDHLTVTAFSSSGDQQVTTALSPAP